MITIETYGDNHFELDGIRFAKIYQPLSQGSEALGIYSVYDTRLQLVNSRKYDEFTIDGVVYTSQEEAIAALLPVIFEGSVAADGDGLILVTDLDNTKDYLWNKLISDTSIYLARSNPLGGEQQMTLGIYQLINNLNANSNRITNLAAGIAGTDAATVSQITGGGLATYEEDAIVVVAETSKQIQHDLNSEDVECVWYSYSDTAGKYLQMQSPPQEANRSLTSIYIISAFAYPNLKVRIKKI